MDSNESQQVDYRLEWRRVKPRTMTTPRIRSCSAGTWLSGNLFLFGGKGAGQFNDTWRFSIQDKEWEKIYFNDSIAPFARDGHAIAKVSETSVMLFGGQGQQIDCGKSERNTDQGRVKFLSMRQLMDDLHEFNCSTLKWEEKKRVKPRPSGRRGHSLTFLPVRTNIRKGTLPANSSSGPPKGNLLLFGGSVFDLSSGCEKPSNEVWIYSLDTEKWIEIKINGISPPPTFGHAATLVGDQLVVVGGNVPHQYRRQAANNGRTDSNMFDETPSTDITILNLPTMSWSRLIIDVVNCSFAYPPSSMLCLTGHSLNLYPLKGDKSMILFGGRRIFEEESQQDSYYGESELDGDLGEEVGDAVGDRSADDSLLRTKPAEVLHLNLATGTVEDISHNIGWMHPVQGERDVYREYPVCTSGHVAFEGKDSVVDIRYIEDKKPSRRFQALDNLPSIAKVGVDYSDKSVLYVYGGNRVYGGGFSESHIYELVMVANIPSKEILRSLSHNSENSNSDVLERGEFITDGGHAGNAGTPDRNSPTEFRRYNDDDSPGRRSKSYSPASGDRFRESSWNSPRKLAPEKRNTDGVDKLGIMAEYNEIKYSLSLSKSIIGSPKTAQHSSCVILPSCRSIVSSQISTSKSLRPNTAPSSGLSTNINGSLGPSASKASSLPALDNNEKLSGDSVNGKTISSEDKIGKRNISKSALALQEHVGAFVPLTQNTHMSKVQAREVYTKIFPKPTYPIEWRAAHSAGNIMLTSFSKK